MTDLLLKETLNNYNKIISIYEATGYSKSYTLNAFWADANMKSMLKILNESNSATQAIHAIQTTFMFSVNTPDPVKEKAVDWLLAEQKDRGIDIFDMNDVIQESRFSNHENNVLRKERILTPDFLRTVNITEEIKRYCKIGGSKFHIIELGGGCGHLARTLRLFMPNCSYAIVDIPETLCFSYMFLKLNFPMLKTLYVADEEQLKECRIDKFDYIFIPTKFAQGILENEIDLFINTASLGEMKNDVIRYWMDFIQNKLKVKYIFTLNRYLNTIRTDRSMDWRLDENEASVLYDSNWKILSWELEPSFTRCPYVDTVIARYLEIIAEKIPHVSVTQRQERSQQLMLEVMHEDWVRLEKSFSSEMSYRDNILVNNMTMSGTLFKLWESIRLYPNAMSVGLMLKYIETLIHRQDREFEETYYYENLFDTLFTDKENKSLLDIHNAIKKKHEHRKVLSDFMPSLHYQLNPPAPFPCLLEEAYEGFNIFKFGDDIYAIAQSLGPVDFNSANFIELRQKYLNKSQCFIGSSISEIKRQIVKLYNNAFKASLVENHKTVEGLKDDIFSKNENMIKLSEDIVECCREIEALRSDILSKENNMEFLKGDILKRDEDIKGLKQELSFRDDNIIKLNEDINVCRRYTQTLREDILSKENNMEFLKGDILKRDEDIKGLKQELSFIKSKWWFKLFKRRCNKNIKVNL